MSARVGRCWVLASVLLLAGCATGLSDNERAARVNVELGMAYLEEANVPAAIDTLSKAVEQAPRDAAAHAALAIAYQRGGQRELAARHFVHAIALDPGDASVRNNYAVALCQEGRFDEAERQFALAVASPRYANPQLALTNAGACARLAGDWQRAGHHLEQALLHSPEYAPALYQLARLAWLQSDPSGARDVLQRLERSAGLDAAALALAIDVHDALGEHAVAAEYRARLEGSHPAGWQPTDIGLSRQRPAGLE